MKLLSGSIYADRIRQSPPSSEIADFAPKNIFRVFGPKIACQAPKPPKLLKQRKIELAY
jgi:hypothetical protein